METKITCDAFSTLGPHATKFVMSRECLDVKVMYSKYAPWPIQNFNISGGSSMINVVEYLLTKDSKRIHLDIKK